MTMKISSDFSAMATSTLSQLHKHQSAMGKSIQRVSTGYKINSAEDGSLKYYLAKKFDMKADEQNATNESMQVGANVLKTADKALNSILDTLKKMKENVQAVAAGTVSGDDISQVSAEYAGFLSDIESVIQNTQFNGNNIFMSTEGGNPTVGDFNVNAVVDATNGWTMSFTVGALNTLLSLNDSSELVSPLSIGADADNAGAAFSVFQADSSESGSEVNVGTRATAASTLLTGGLKSAFDQVTSIQGNIATALSRINGATDYLEDMADINTESRDIIKNADQAKEMTEYVRQNVLAQASQAMLSQANSGLASVLNLLS